MTTNQSTSGSTPTSLDPTISSVHPTADPSPGNLHPPAETTAGKLRPLAEAAAGRLRSTAGGISRPVTAAGSRATATVRRNPKKSATAT
ncbi:MAG TPA: hypothetical protein VN408_17105, partial [Actinoplanes sp.]|nr:hypothetical protein [Actinoplanes sp.]